MQTAIEILKEKFAYNDFLPEQKKIIEDLKLGKNVLAVFPTGFGKSICFQVPALMREGLTIVISPLIALMKDQVDNLKEKNINAEFINSSLNKKQREEIYTKLKRHEVKLLYLTPERFRKKEFCDLIKTIQVSLLAIDEAHCIYQWGFDFRPEYTRLKEIRDFLNKPQTIALTATATSVIQKEIIANIDLKDEELVIHQGTVYRKNLNLSVIDLYDDKAKTASIIDILKKKPGATIIYFSLIKTLNYFSEKLDTAGMKHSVYHGDLDREKRRKIQEKFIKSENQIILATNAFGMGVDKSNIRTIIHAELPSSLEDYYQEIGRAGRDGKKSDCILLYCEDDIRIQMEFIEWKNPDEDFVEYVYQILESDIDAVNAYGYEYFKEKLTYKVRRDYRLETVLSLFDRYQVTSGSINSKDLKLLGDIPEMLIDENVINEKRKRSQLSLLNLVNYTKSEKKFQYIIDYFEKKS